MKRGTTIFLKIALFLIGIPILALWIVVLPLIIKDAGEGSAQMAYVLYGILTIMFVSTIPFYVALYQAFTLLNYIDKNKAFSDISVKALKKIKNCATTISILFMAGMPLFYIVGEVDDAPGVIVIGMVIIFASMVISVFAAVLQRLLQEAIHIKSENDLTV